MNRRQQQELQDQEELAQLEAEIALEEGEVRQLCPLGRYGRRTYLVVGELKKLRTRGICSAD